MKQDHMGRQDMDTPVEAAMDGIEDQSMQRSSLSSNRVYNERTQKGSSKRSSSRSSNDKRHNNGDSTSRPSYQHSSSKQVSSSSARRPSSRSKDGRKRPPRKHSTDSTSDTETLNALTGRDETQVPAQKASKERVHGRSGNVDESNQRSKSRSPMRGTSRRSAVIETLYGTEEEEQEKKRLQRSNPQRATAPGVQHITSTRGSAVNTLYGDEKESTEKSWRERSVRDSRKPGVEHVSSHSILAITTLYGENSDAKAKARALRENSVGSCKPSSAENKSTISTLYGSDEDAKAKARASIRSSEHRRVPLDKICIDSSAHSTISTLYGNSADSKAKAASFRGASQFASPGVEIVHNGDSGITSILYGDDMDAKAKERIARGGAMFAANPGVESAERPLNVSSRGSEVFGNASAYNSESDAQEPMARRVSIGSTDSESIGETESEPKLAADFGGVSAEAKDAVRLLNDPEHGGSRKREAFKDPKKSKKNRFTLFFFASLLIGGGVAAWHFLFRNDDINSDGGRSGTSDLENPTTAPSLQTPVSLTPNVQLDAGNATLFPSAPPSIKLLYEPPSESDCIAIALNRTIAGREAKENVDFGLHLEVVLSKNTTMTKALLQELLSAIQEKILPSLAGCKIFLDEVVESWRFVIFDAFVKGNDLPEDECTNEELVSQNCHRIFVELDLFLKGTVKFLDIFRLISNEEENFSNHLGLSDSFSVVKMIGAKSLTPTIAPTVTPSNSPSRARTYFPTIQGSAVPTPIPSMNPTTNASGQPTRLRTLIPTAEPSRGATTALPSSNPTLALSEVPSDKPSSRPSVITQTSLPSESPSNRPTKTPSMVPSHTPTGKPSLSPTVDQSKSPSGKPTQRPSSAPSSRPSALPTSVPSGLPSLPPSTGPTAVYWPVGVNKKCPYQHPDRLFKIDIVANVDECYNACLNTAGCVIFSIGMSNGNLNCMGCRTIATMEYHDGFIAYELGS